MDFIGTFGRFRNHPKYYLTAFFAKIAANGSEPSTVSMTKLLAVVFTESSIIDVRLGSEYVSSVSC